MQFQGFIEEDVFYFDPIEKAAWTTPEIPSWLITEPRHRFLYCRINDDYSPRGKIPYDFDRPFYFMMAKFISEQHHRYDMMWHERYKLALKKSSGKYQRSNAEIESLMGTDVCERLRRLNSDWAAIFADQAARYKPSQFAFKDPDILAYGNQRFSFFELKSKGEGFQPFQLESLAVLKHCVPCSHVRVIRTLAHGSTYTPLQHAYSIEIPEDLL